MIAVPKWPDKEVMMTRIVNDQGQTMNLQPQNAVAVTPNDSSDLAVTPATLYVGTTGDVKVTMYGQGTVTFVMVPAGLFPVLVSRVWSTGTTATDIIALY